MTRIVNILSAKMELGSPMISMYLLGNPDHYTNAKFTPFYWKSFVHHVRKSFDPVPGSDEDDEKVMLLRNGTTIVGVTKVQDYIFRPRELEDISLYDFV
ncbi:hypothetical protein BDN72DRAFT_748066, partial [Pluteus cervinus]